MKSYPWAYIDRDLKLIFYNCKTHTKMEQDLWKIKRNKKYITYTIIKFSLENFFNPINSISLLFGIHHARAAHLDFNKVYMEKKKDRKENNVFERETYFACEKFFSFEKSVHTTFYRTQEYWHHTCKLLWHFQCELSINICIFLQSSCD